MGVHKGGMVTLLLLVTSPPLSTTAVPSTLLLPQLASGWRKAVGYLLSPLPLRWLVGGREGKSASDRRWGKLGRESRPGALWASLLDQWTYKVEALCFKIPFKLSDPRVKSCFCGNLIGPRWAVQVAPWGENAMSMFNWIVQSFFHLLNCILPLSNFTIENLNVH